MKSYKELYDRCVNRFNNRFEKSIVRELTPNANELIRLTKKVFDWQKYLTQKQIEAVNLYLQSYEVQWVASKLNISESAARTRLFGDKKTKGAIDKLKEIEKNYEKIEVKELENNLKESKVHKKTNEKIDLILKYVNEIPDYNQYLTARQNQVLKLFLTIRDIEKIAKELKISISTVREHLFGTNKRIKYDILHKLEYQYKITTLNDWNEL